MSEERFRILVLGDFSARGHRGLSDTGSAGGGRTRRVDRDTVDTVIAELAPVLHVEIEPGAPPVEIRVRAMDDFHPDSLVERVAEFQRLRALRDEVTAGKVSGGDQAKTVRRASPPVADAGKLTGGSVLDLILGAEPSAPLPESLRPRDELSEFVSQAVRPHTVSQPSANQQTLVAQINDVIAATMRVVLHQQDFQAAEALWRGTEFLVRRLDTDEAVELHVADVTKAELVAAAAAPDSAGKALRRLLRDEARGGWSLAIGAYTFAPEEISSIALVAALARSTGVPLISAATSAFAAVGSFGESADPDDWDKSPIGAWDAFRGTPDAKWISLALPRVLLRVPYGKRSDECAFAFEETSDGALAHEHYLWGSGAFLPALLFGEAAADGDLAPSHGTVDGLPMFVETVDGSPSVKPPAEALLGGRAVSHLVDRGLTVVASERDGDSARLPRIQSVAFPPAPLASPVSPAGE